MTGLKEDLRHALRTARRHPGFSAFVVATMAVGIGLNSAVFSLIDALLLRPPAVAAPDRLANVYSSVPGEPVSHAPMAFPDYETVRDRARSFDGLAAHAWYPLALERGDGSRLVLAEAVTGNYFATLGVSPARGRFFGAAEDEPAAPDFVAVLSHEGWQRHFAGAADVVGRKLRLNGRAFTVMGVAPRAFHGLVPGVAPDLWLPIRAALTLPMGVTITFGDVTTGRDRTADRAQRWVWVTGRLRPDTSVERAGAELALLSSQLAREFPDTNARRSLVAVASRDVRLLPGVDRAVRAGSLLVMGVFALGLLLASVNVASLFLARALGRRSEIATRLAIGAGRGRLVRQLFLEGLLLALAGGGFGLLLGHASNAVLGRIDLGLGSAVNWPLDLVLAPALDLRVLGYTLAASVATAVVFSLAPAFEATREDLAGMLRRTGAAASAGSSAGLRATMVAGQVAISVVVLTAAGAASRNLLDTMRIDPGFDPERAAAVTLSPDLLGYGPDEAEGLLTRLRQRLSQLPGVRSAALASHLPLTAAINFGHVAPAGRDAETGVLVDFASVGPQYFETMGIALVAGRPFAEGDGPSAPRVVLVNEALARRLWPEFPPLGKRLSDGAEVVGVVRDGKYRTLGESPRPFLYTSLAADRRGTCTVVVRTAGDPRPLLPAIRDAIRELDPRLPVSGPRTLAETVADALLLPRLAAAVFGSFGALGLLLTAAGVFGVVAHLATARTREIGLRMALGAGRGAILRLLLRKGLSPVAAGLAVGIAAAASGTWALSGLFAAIGPIDRHGFTAVVLLLALVAGAAAIAPARLAAQGDPASALRHE